MILLLVLLGYSSADAESDRRHLSARSRTLVSAQYQSTVFDMRLHYSGSYWASVGNDGELGQSASFPFDYEHPDLTRLGIRALSGWEFPSRTSNQYLARLEILVGTIRDHFDTLVSTHPGIVHDGYNSGFEGREFHSSQKIQEYSNIRSSAHYSPSAHADQEYHTVYSDTLLDPFSPGGLDYIEQRYHKPIGVEVHQKTYSWSDAFARQFLIVQNWIVNISDRAIQSPAVGVYMDADLVHGVSSTQYDDICGFTRTVPSKVEGFDDTLDLYWAIDNDGDPLSANDWDEYSQRGVVGIRILKSPARASRSFNWWATRASNETYTIDWGPRSAIESQGYAGGIGVPRGDRGRYRMMTNGEFDYLQVEAAQDKSAQGWARPLGFGPDAVDVADGLDTRFLVSYYGFDEIAPGDSVPLDFAVVCARNVHQDPGNFVRNFDSRDPRRYMESLDFSELFQVARSAASVYDTPGYDSAPDDGVDYKGEAYLANCTPQGCDTVWYKGDGIPDLATTSPPVAPNVSVTTSPNRAVLRWSGFETECLPDPLTHKRDFEGYRIYVAKKDREDMYALAGSWDRIDFKRIAYKPSTSQWIQITDPLTPEKWKDTLGDHDFDPMKYSRPSFQTAYKDTVMDTTRSSSGEIVSVSARLRYSYWAREAVNHENEYQDAGGVLPNRIQRIETRDTVVDGELLTFGVYEAVFDDLNAAIPLYVAVTAFEFSDYESQLPAAESLPTNNSNFLIPIYSADAVTDSNLKVSVYPNPYKLRFIDHYGNVASYQSQGYEVPEGVKFQEQDRRIWFINLPDTATIHIYSLDGDLIREIHHPDIHLTKYSSAVGWDLVTRNTQAVVSGIYIWKVDSRLGSQVGKIVIIK